MPVSPLPFAELMRAVLRRDPAATEQFCREFQAPILKVVRLRLMRRLRSKYDPLDLVHDVWASFFAAPPCDRQFDRPEEVIAYLEELARRKVIKVVRHGTTEKRDVTRELRFPDGSSYLGLKARDPSPSQELRAKEEWQRLVRAVKEAPPRHLRILTLLRHGLTHREIAARLNTNEKTVQRLIRRLDPRPRT
jgi:RNA polymerase sigma factor (sigma-70 family)